MAGLKINNFLNCIFLLLFILTPTFSFGVEKSQGKKTPSQNATVQKNEGNKTWDEYFKRKMFDPPEGFVTQGLMLIGKDAKGKVAIDLGAGVGHESKLLLKMGYKVVAVDSDPRAFKYMLLQPDIQKNRSQLTTVLSKFQTLKFDTLPKADLIVASFALPFVSEKDFNKVWENVVSSLKPGGHVIMNLFAPGFTYFDKKYHANMTFHTKSEAVALFKNFKIIQFREVNAKSFMPGKKNNYYVIIAQKK